jgi:hypothetical protein
LVFQQATDVSFGFSVVIILGLLVTALKMLSITNEEDTVLNLTEKIFLKGALSIYSGWLTIATIVIYNFLI